MNYTTYSYTTYSYTTYSYTTYSYTTYSYTTYSYTLHALHTVAPFILPLHLHSDWPLLSFDADAVHLSCSLEQDGRIVTAPRAVEERIGH
jgi:hypothetical protein